MRPLSRLLARRDRPVDAPLPGLVPSPVPGQARASDTAPPDDAARAEALDLVEADVLRAIARVSGAVATASGAVEGAGADLAAIGAHVGAVAEAARGAGDRAVEVAGSAQRLAASAGDITAAMDGAGDRLADAAASARDAHALIGELARASAEINGIIDAIAAVARQTNLLALNATIEAARAGPAGRGFAVVAGEVKALSVETGRAADEVRARIARLSASAKASIGAVERVADVVSGVQPVFATVRAATAEQGAAIADLTRQAREAAGFVDAVGEQAAQVDAAALDARRRVEEATRAAAAATDLAGGLGRRFVAVMRQNAFGDRRRRDRYPIELGVRVAGAGAAQTVDLGEGGLLFAPVPSPEPAVGSRLTLEVERLGAVSVRVAAVSTMGVHCAIDETDAAALARAAAAVAALARDYAPLVATARDAAGRVAAAFERAVAAGLLTREALFDVDYQPVAGSDPPQFATRALAVLEEVLPPILEPLLVSDNRMVFCIAVDRNGYVPVHNRRFAQAQRPGDTAWNTANARDRRIFDDRAGITAARSTRPFTVQAYRRDMGGGTTVMMREIDAPIRVLDRHWGGFRTAYRL